MNKSLILLACVFVGVNALSRELIDEMVHKVGEKGAECATIEKASEADMELLMKKKIPNSHEGKCVIYCIFKKLNIMRPDGSFGAGDEVWLEKAKADDADFYTKFTTMYKDCESKIESEVDPCDKASTLTECVKEEAIKQCPKFCTECGSCGTGYKHHVAFSGCLFLTLKVDVVSADET